MSNTAEFDGSALQSLLKALSQGPQIVALFDAEDRLRHANTAFRKIYMHGLEGSTTFSGIIRYAFHQQTGPKIESKDVEAFLATIQLKRRMSPQRAFAVDLIDGRWLWINETMLDDGWLLLVGSDITELKHDEKTLRKAHDEALLASRTDILTGLSNRRRILDLARDCLAEARRASKPFSLTMIDIDHFKRINDSIGHEGGDRVLVHFSATCHARMRESDLIGRFGGEEFLLILPGSAAQEAANVIQRLREYLHSSTTPNPSVLPRYTFSAGIAEGLPDDDIDSLIRRADEALYKAKHAGRDQLRIATGPVP